MEGWSAEVVKAAKEEVEAAVAAGLAEAQQLAMATLVEACRKGVATMEGEGVQRESNGGTTSTSDSLSSDLSKLSMTPSIPPLPRNGLERLHHLAQTLGMAAALLGCCQALLRPVKASASKKNKKRKDPSVTVSCIQYSYYIVFLCNSVYSFIYHILFSYGSIMLLTVGGDD